MKRHLQCAEQQVSRSNLTKYCACHEKWRDCFIVLTYETSFPMRGATDVTIQPHQILRLSRRKTHMLNPHHISNLIYNVRSNRCPPPTSANTAPATKIDTAKFQRKCPKTGETSFPMRGRSEHDPTMIRAWSDHDPTMKLTVRNPPRQWGYFSNSPRAFSIEKYNVSRPILHSNIHQMLHPPPKVALELHQILPLPWKVTLELHQVLHLPQKVVLELHQILRLPRKVTLELHQVLHLPGKVTLELHQILRLPQKVTLELHQVLHLPRKVTLELHQVLHLPRKVTLEFHEVLRLPRKVTLEFHQMLRLSRRKTHMLNPHHISNLIYNARSNRCPPPTSANTAPATKIDTAKFQTKCPKTGETSFPMRRRSEHDPTMKPTVRNPPRKWGYFSNSPRAFSIEKYNVSHPILHSNIHQMLHPPQKVALELHQILRLPWKVTLELHQVLHLPQKVALELHQILRLPRKVTLELHQVLHLPRKVTLELHQILRLPQKVTLELHQVLHLPRKVPLELHQILWHYSTWHYLTLLYLTLLSTWHYSTWLYLTLLDTTVLDSTWLYLTLLYLTFLDSTLLDLTLLYLTLLGCRSYIGSFSAKLPLTT